MTRVFKENTNLNDEEVPLDGGMRPKGSIDLFGHFVYDVRLEG